MTPRPYSFSVISSGLRVSRSNGGYSALVFRSQLPNIGKDALDRKVTLDTSMSLEKHEAGRGLDIAAMRRSYGELGLEAAPENPFSLFTQWLEEAHTNPAIVEANAMVLSTADFHGQITSRTVLLKAVVEERFVFFTNYNSRKGQAIHSQPRVALLFPWFAMERQVSVSGSAEKISEAESAQYFASRPWGHQIGTWASRQSDPLSERSELEERWAAAASKWPEGSVVPKPPHWGGYSVVPNEIEFWQGRYSRLHDRIRYSRQNFERETEWENQRYYP